MARRRTTKKRRSGPRAVSLINMIELYALTDIMSRGLTGFSPWQFLTEGGDIRGKM